VAADRHLAGDVAHGLAGVRLVAQLDAASVHPLDCSNRRRADVGIFPNPRQSSASSAPSLPREVSAIEAAA
jgi:hypothetical protein